MGKKPSPSILQTSERDRTGFDLEGKRLSDVLHGLLQERGNVLRSWWPKVRSTSFWTLGAYISLLGFLLFTAAYNRWCDPWTPTLLQRPLRTATDLGSQIVCSAPGVNKICNLVCSWDDHADIFPTVCLGGGPGSFDNLFGETYGNLSESMRFSVKLHGAPKKLKEHRNAIFLLLDEMKMIHSTGEVEKVNFAQLETRLEGILGLMRDAPEDLFVFLDYVGNLTDTVLFETQATKTVVERILKDESATYHSSNSARGKTTLQKLLRDRLLKHIREWKIVVEKLIKPGKLIKIRFNKLEDEYEPLRGSIRTAITQMMNQKDSTMGPRSLWKRLSVHLGMAKPREIRYLMEGLREFDELHKVIEDLSNLSNRFEDLWTSTMIISTNLDKMMDIVWKRRDALYKVESEEQEQLVSLVGRLESSAKEIREANERAEGTKRFHLRSARSQPSFFWWANQEMEVARLPDVGQPALI